MIDFDKKNILNNELKFTKKKLYLSRFNEYILKKKNKWVLTLLIGHFNGGSNFSITLDHN